VRMVYDVARAVQVPVIGIGGIATADDALQFILAGATAVQVGTATFGNPRAMIEVIDGIRAFCEREGVADVNELVGAALP
ncbi:MAG: tRNA-dihydrouridine synthase, partial [Chloroflexi bacterium]|nr:tRNA-dihydrouridine synthase [Chloroflexota bacterium]